jgi:hypothetical protein
MSGSSNTNASASASPDFTERFIRAEMLQELNNKHMVMCKMYDNGWETHRQGCGGTRLHTETRSENKTEPQTLNMIMVVVV